MVNIERAVAPWMHHIISCMPFVIGDAFLYVLMFAVVVCCILCAFGLFFLSLVNVTQHCVYVVIGGENLLGKYVVFIDSMLNLEYCD